jgi:hypothetical protein
MEPRGRAPVEELAARPRKLMRVTATRANWSVTCDDPEIAAQLEELKPERLGYLPFPELDWARECERRLKARVVTVHPPRSDGPEIPGGLCFSGGPA